MSLSQANPQRRTPNEASTYLFYLLFTDHQTVRSHCDKHPETLDHTDVVAVCNCMLTRKSFKQSSLHKPTASELGDGLYSRCHLCSSLSVAPHGNASTWKRGVARSRLYVHCDWHATLELVFFFVIPWPLSQNVPHRRSVHAKMMTVMRK